MIIDLKVIRSILLGIFLLNIDDIVVLLGLQVEV